MWIRPMLLSDVDEIRNLECVIFSDAWSENNLKESIMSDMDYCFIMEDEYKIAAYIIFRVNGEEAELFRIATDNEKRKKGCGQKLMTMMMSSLDSMGVKKVFLEVRSQNKPAISLYDRCGFKKIGIRKGYYNDPDDDAFIMLTSINNV